LKCLQHKERKKGRNKTRMNQSKTILQEIMFYMRYRDRSNEVIIDHIEYLMKLYDEAIKNEEKR